MSVAIFVLTKMSCGVSCINWRVVHISISIPSLNSLILWNYAIHLGETSQHRVIPTRIIVHESEVRGVGVLSRVGVARGRCLSLIADGIVVDIRIAIPRLRTDRVGNYGVRLNEVINTRRLRCFGEIKRTTTSV